MVEKGKRKMWNRIFSIYAFLTLTPDGCLHYLCLLPMRMPFKTKNVYGCRLIYIHTGECTYVIGKNVTDFECKE